MNKERRNEIREIKAIEARGYMVVMPADGPTITCATGGTGDTYSTSDWASLAFYAEHYELCDCGNHEEGSL